MTKPRFLIDSMLGKAARKMRILGYDTAYTADADSDMMLDKAISSGRTIITASATLHDRAQAADIPSILTPSHPPDVTMRHIIRISGISADINIDEARCALCNGKTSPTYHMSSDGVKAGTISHIKKFRRCEACNHIYWEGAHIRNLQKERDRWM